MQSHYIQILQEWEREWQMVFNPDKCERIRITKRKIIQTSYNINAKYLGVTIDNTPSWNSHIDAVTKNANQTTAFLHRNLSSCPKDVKAKCYKSVVRPQLEYASTVWDPVTKTNIAKVKYVQRRFGRFYYRVTMTIAEPAVSLLCCKNLLGRTSNQGENRTKSQWCTGFSITSSKSQQTKTWQPLVHQQGHQQQFLVPYCSI